MGRKWGKQIERAGKEKGSQKAFFPTSAQGLAVCYVISCHYFLSERTGTASLQVSWLNCTVCPPPKNLLSPHQNKQSPLGLKWQTQPDTTESNKSLLSLFIPSSQQFSIRDIFPFLWQHMATHIHWVQAYLFFFFRKVLYSSGNTGEYLTTCQKSNMTIYSYAQKCTAAYYKWAISQ